VDLTSMCTLCLCSMMVSHKYKFIFASIVFLWLACLFSICKSQQYDYIGAKF
jgi:hypothetical protein